jgi:hypothetical protein
VPLARDRFLYRVRSVLVTPDEVSLRLRSGLELRLGAATAVPLKLVIARRIAPTLGADQARLYVDVTAPDRPVVGVRKSQPVG